MGAAEGMIGRTFLFGFENARRGTRSGKEFSVVRIEFLAGERKSGRAKHRPYKNGQVPGGPFGSAQGEGRK
jgi:hypothetical protein